MKMQVPASHQSKKRKKQRNSVNLSRTRRRSNRKRITRRRAHKIAPMIHWRELLVSMLLAIGGTVILFLFFYRASGVKGYSMSPTLMNGDLLIVKKQAEIERFNLVQLALPSGKQQIRRVIGLPGETIIYKEDVLYVNHQPVDEKFIIAEINDRKESGVTFTEDYSTESLKTGPIIPEGCYFVLGDNRPYTTDSRQNGLVTAKEIRGVVQLRLFPFDEIAAF